MIITISREFGSGGRELGKRLSEALGIPCYDHEIIQMIAKEHGFDENFVAHLSEKSLQASYPPTIGHRLSATPHAMTKQAIKVVVEQRKIIEGFAKQGDCVIVGRCADVILADYHPLNIFVYADKAAKLQRCIDRAPQGENLAVPELERKMRSIDKQRAQHRELYTTTKWGAKENYHLCVNTSGKEIKTLIPAIVQYVKAWQTNCC